MRERTRQAVRSELIDVAQRLFAERGFEAVTVDEIATAAGMSRRSFFRYFASKEDVVLSKVERLGEDFAAALAARPDTEPLWEALRRMFDGAVTYAEDPLLGRHAANMDRVIGSSETLRAGYLQRMQAAQQRVVDELAAREDRLGHRGRLSVALPALVAAAFAALLTAHAWSLAEEVPFSAALDAAMRAITDGSSTGLQD